ncbi:MAG: ExbD/TolR family protein [Planctomycetota bacterium]
MSGRIVAQARQEAADLNIMPMIDCVFQLIIFFMVVTEIKKSDDADVQLPRTRYAQIDAPPPFDRVVVNGVFRVADERRSDYSVRDALVVRNRVYDSGTLADYLRAADRQVRLRGNPPGRSQAQSSALHVKIRADARCSWAVVEQAQAACTKAGVYRVSYGTQPAQRVARGVE